MINHTEVSIKWDHRIRVQIN